MSRSNELDRGVDHVFENPDPRGVSATTLFLGGFGLIALAVAGFVATIGTRRGQAALHLTTTLPIIVAVGMLARALKVRDLPRRVVVGPDGIEIVNGRGERRYFWSEIGSASVANVLNTPKTYLRVTDTAGRTIIQVEESFPGYPSLVKLVESHVDAKPDDTSAQIMAGKARRMALVSFAGGCFLAFAAVFLATEARERQRADSLLARQGVPGEGELVRRFVAPDGVTRRIEYRVAGSETRNVEVHPAFWELLEGARTVNVVYVPAEPGVSRLALGEVREDDFVRTPKGGYLLAALGGLMAVAMLAYSPVAWMGYDLAFDEKDRTWRVKRHGRVVWASK